MNAVDVTISEVGPRDGLQNTESFMPTAAKNAWTSAEATPGVHEIEVCSVVPAKLIPQFVDAEQVLAHVNICGARGRARLDLEAISELPKWPLI